MNFICAANFGGVRKLSDGSTLLLQKFWGSSEFFNRVTLLDFFGRVRVDSDAYRMVILVTKLDQKT